MTAQLIEDMPFPVYLADPAPSPSLTASLVRELLGTAPRAVWERTPRLNLDAEPRHESKFDLGTAAHALFVGHGDPIVEIDAADFKTKAAREARDAARARGRTPVLIADMQRVTDMAIAAEEAFGKNSDICSALGECGKREATILWKEDGVHCRCRPDIALFSPSVNVSDNKRMATIVHYKTTATTLSLDGLTRLAGAQGWDLTAAHYAAGVRALGYTFAVSQIFAVQEVARPYLCMAVQLDNTFVEAAEAVRSRIVRLWRTCLERDDWPGHSPETTLLSPPTWHETARVAQRDSYMDARSGGDAFDRMFRWQSPLWLRPHPAVKSAVRAAEDAVEQAKRDYTGGDR